MTVRPSTVALPPHIARYDRPTIALHWLTASLVGVLWVIGMPWWRTAS